MGHSITNKATQRARRGTPDDTTTQWVSKREFLFSHKEFWSILVALILQVSFRKRATTHWAHLQKMTCKMRATILARRIRHVCAEGREFRVMSYMNRPCHVRMSLAAQRQAHLCCIIGTCSRFLAWPVRRVCAESCTEACARKHAHGGLNAHQERKIRRRRIANHNKELGSVWPCLAVNAKYFPLSLWHHLPLVVSACT